MVNKVLLWKGGWNCNGSWKVLLIYSRCNF